MRVADAKRRLRSAASDWYRGASLRRVVDHELLLSTALAYWHLHCCTRYAAANADQPTPVATGTLL